MNDWIAMTLEEKVEKNIKLTDKIANKYKGRMEFDDLKQICSISLMKAANSFDPDRGATFATYACRIMQNDINSELERTRNHKSEFVMEEIETCMDCGYDISEDVENSVLLDSIRKMVTDNEFKALYLHYGLKYSQSEVARILGTLQPQVFRILERAKKKVRANMQLAS